MQNTESRLNVAVIGVGHLGRIHARLWKRIPGAELVGVYDVDPERSESIASELEVGTFSTLEELYGAVDAVSIVTPTSTHAAIAAEALGRGIHCFIEKPITATYEEALRLIELADSRGLTLQVGHVERFNPAFLALGGETLQPMFIESHRLAQFKPRATDVAVVLDLMIHDIDLILHIVGAEVREVRASGVAVVSDSIDIANARIEFANGCVANLTASRISQKQMRKMRLFQKDSYISIDFAEPAVEIFRIGSDRVTHVDVPSIYLGEIEAGTRRRSILYERPEVLPGNAIERELQEFVDAVRNGTPPPVTAAAGAEALRLAEEIIREIEERKVVG
jgi:predicted dehydrogenase